MQCKGEKGSICVPFILNPYFILSKWGNYENLSQQNVGFFSAMAMLPIFFLFTSYFATSRDGFWTFSEYFLSSDGILEITAHQIRAFFEMCKNRSNFTSP